MKLIVGIVVFGILVRAALVVCAGILAGRWERWQT